MGRTVDELKRSMTLREFNEYVAFWEMEPFGDDVRMMAQVCWMLWVANGGQKQKKLAVEDFMPRRIREQKPEDIGGAMLAWAESMQGMAAETE
jgi:hypothetical protein